MRTAEIRQRFLDHFKALDHTVVPSASLLADDPNLLFVPAGMVPFKPYFLGQVPAPYKRAASVQKCVRTLDIDEVGKTTRHGSFFQMNGNFSFGDYFKEAAARYAWDLVTRPQSDGGYGFDESKLWVTAYLDDDEAVEIWQKIGVPADRIVRRGIEDNFWSMGVPGPCGPCSEIYVDRGRDYGPDGGPEVDEDRYLEIWNLVFMQNERGPGGAKKDFEILGDLPAKNIDTGMGLERVSCLLQGVDNLYEIDEVRPVLDRAAELARVKYGADRTADVRLRVIADHVRTGLMLIGDGVVPGNVGRGYVLRRILRRAVRAMRLLGYEDPALPELLPVSRDCMSPSYPDVASDFERISRLAYAEEESFRATLRAGTTIFESAVAEVRTAGASELAGDKAFELHATYGFPIDLTLEMAAEQGLSVDEDGFRRLMTEHQELAREDAAARKSGHVDTTAYRQVLDRNGPSRFTGYAELARESRVTGVLGDDGLLPAAGEGAEIEVVLDTTPFYAEGGGQQADHGRIAVDGGEVEVIDVQSPVEGLVVHRVKVLSGEIRPGQDAHAVVDVDRRKAVSRSHTATHLVHRAMRNFLGDSAAQAGSLNAPGRLRFDFANPAAVPADVLGDVEEQVNEILLEDLEVRDFVTDQAEARRIGAIALFGEKYGDAVRVVEVGEYSRELCGGTHVPRSAHVGMVKLLGESSIGSGVRRVEALVGLDALRFLAREHVLVSQLAETFRARPEELPDRIDAVLTQLRDAEKEVKRLRAAAVLANAGALAASAADVAGVALVATEAPEGTGGNDVRKLVNDVRGRLQGDRPGVVAVAARAGGKATLVVAVTESAKRRGLSAAGLVRGALSGRGGGSDDLAQGGGVPAEAAPGLLTRVSDLVAEQVSAGSA
jgi:alanyl-tRNA synthetase